MVNEPLMDLVGHRELDLIVSRVRIPGHDRLKLFHSSLFHLFLRDTMFFWIRYPPQTISVNLTDKTPIFRIYNPLYI